jgi:hypothetical protein
MRRSSPLVGLALLAACAEVPVDLASGASAADMASPPPWAGAGEDADGLTEGGDPVGGLDEDPPAVLTVTLTDAPGDFDAVPVTIGAVYAHAVPSGADDSGLDDDGAWVVLGDEASDWDLLALQGGVTGLLGSGAVPAVAYDQVRIVVTDAAVVIDGETLPLALPSAARSGLKLSADLDLTGGGAYELRLDFDAHESIRQNPGRGWMMSPVVRVDHFGPVEADDTGR